MLLRPGVTGREWDTSADNGVRAKRPRFHPLQVHGSASSMAETLVKAENFCQGPLKICLDLCAYRVHRIHGATGGARQISKPFGEELVVAAVRTVDAIAGAQHHCRAYSATFLPNA
ncbi:hypothetical protein StoSoilB19_17180 [Arthrobacter sp. StoSoilB19]|nr:hypothetical protein StoSoilB19_17180 [Arthrobacter sp. StoSoilB19]